MNSFLEGIIEGLKDGRYTSSLRSLCERWREHPTQYAIAFAVRHAIESDNQQLIYESLADPDFRKLKSDGFGADSLRADILSAMDYFSTRKHNLLRYYQLLFLGQQVNVFTRYHSNSKYQNYCQAYLQFLQLNEPPSRRANIGITRVLTRRFPMEFNDQYQERRDKIELLSYEIGDWRCQCGARRGHAQRYDLECKACRIQVGNGVIDGDEERCSHCGGPITYVACSECNTRVTLDILWRIENSSIHPREMMLPLHVSLRRFIDGTPQDTSSLTLLQFPIMFGINEKRGSLYFDSPGLIWIDTPNRKSSVYVFDEDVKYDRQTEPLKIFEALLSRTFSPYRYLRSSLKSILQRGYGYREKAFTQGFSRRMAKIAQATLPISNDFPFECITSAVNSLTHNMAIINQNSILAKKLMAPSVIYKIISLRPGDILTPNPQGKGMSINLDDDGIVTIGTLVNPGDVLVGIVRVEKQRATTAQERLLTALFGAKIISMDRSRVYDGIIPARVIAVEVETSRGDAFHLYSGKTIKRDELWQSEQITITLSLEQLIGIGDTLYAEDNSKVVICETANGHQLKDLAGCTVEPDLLISTNHPWATTCLETPSKCYPLQMFIRPDTLNGRNINARTSGYYSLIDHQPITYASDYNVAQIMTKDDFSWLLSYGLMDIVFELLHVHSDCIEVRTNLYKLAENDRISLDETCNSPLTPPTDLVNAPGETIRYLAFLLRGLGIRVSIEFTPEPMMRFHVIEDSDRLAWSRGEVTKQSPIDYARTRSVQDSLFSERIFGPTEDWNCSCGKYKDTPWFKGFICDTCGVEVTRSMVRRERVGHIELAVPVINPLYLGYVCSILSNILPLKHSEIKSLIYYERLGESDRRNMASRIGKDDLKDENFTSLLQEIAKEFSRVEEDHKSRIVSLIGKDERGALAIQKLIEYHVTPADTRKHHLFLEKVIMKSVLVIPPDLRQGIQYDDGRFPTSHLDCLYSSTACHKFVPGFMHVPQLRTSSHGGMHMRQAVLGSSVRIIISNA